MNLSHPFIDANGDKLREECGIFGTINADNASALTALGLHALQHRGQEAAGITSYNGDRFYSVRGTGHVADNFSTEEALAELPGHMAAGHVRYSTTGGSGLRNVQPLFADLASGGFAVAHNGNISNARTLRDDLVSRGAIFQSTSDTEVIIHLVATSRYPTMIDRIVDALRMVEGAYSLIIMTPEGMIACRDPHGIRPLVMGKVGDTITFASESVAFNVIGAEMIREVEPGELIRVDYDGKIESLHPFGNIKPRPCIFEHVYFSRPDSVFVGQSVYSSRKSIGEQLAIENPAEVDLVVPVPDSGVPAAIGYAQQAGIPFELGIIRSHYVGRTFIQPTQGARTSSVSLKHNANRALVEGKRIVLIDDSLVRGTTSIKIVQMMRDAGATEVHFRVASPPFANSCFYGVDTPEREKLLAAQMDMDAMRDHIGADSLAFVSIDGLYRAVGLEGRNSACPQYCDACFTGEYPTPLTDQAGRDDKDAQLSFDRVA
ncbi:amidophosphoribosyltransferase [Pontixanthobacter aquaemixtae]|uniref:Amidophosphoribosyltransferase n=1 Tax=Pontixanthobacter aquaemixtae TaxID=1958940 RepID=A0A844ZY77_9SPHN|nr:amidophosphoribosyltransferase [Pontixanthobacter aquaemixtae]MXO90429.1 amidophosphoribosyltransferase [Pontixanthobacter aquaemixtae]